MHAWVCMCVCVCVYIRMWESMYVNVGICMCVLDIVCSAACTTYVILYVFTVD